MSKLTDNEKAVVQVCLNADNFESQMADNYSNYELETVCKVLNMNEKQAGGVLSNMEQKGLIWFEDIEDIKRNRWVVVARHAQLTEKALKLYFNKV